MPRIMATYNKNEMLPERKVALNQWSQHTILAIKNYTSFLSFGMCNKSFGSRADHFFGLLTLSFLLFVMVAQQKKFI